MGNLKAYLRLTAFILLGADSLGFPTPQSPTCGWDFSKNFHCPDYSNSPMSEWQRQVQCWHCSNVTEYHCARVIGENEEYFMEGCAVPKNCTLGTEPRMDIDKRTITCENCHDPDKFIDDNLKLSSTFYDCSLDKTICTPKFKENFKENFKEFKPISCGRREKSSENRWCRCDQRNNYIFYDEYPDEYGCSNGNHMKCVKYTIDCPDGKDRSVKKDYKICLEDCPTGKYRPHDSDDCSQTRDISKEQGYTTRSSAEIIGSSLGESCTDVSQCNASNTLCSNTCQCAITHYDDSGTADVGGSCLPKSSLGQSCTDVSQCMNSNALCSKGTCQCENIYYDDTGNSDFGGSCIPKAGLDKLCPNPMQSSVSNTCCDSSATCKLVSSGVYMCQCNSGYSNDDGRCTVSSDGRTVIIVIVIVIVVVIVVVVAVAVWWIRRHIRQIENPEPVVVYRTVPQEDIDGHQAENIEGQQNRDDNQGVHTTAVQQIPGIGQAGQSGSSTEQVTETAILAKEPTPAITESVKDEDDDSKQHDYPKRLNHSAIELKDIYKDVLKRLYTYIVEDMDPKSVRDRLNGENIFLDVSIRDIKDKPDQSEENRAILDLFKRGGSEKYIVFKKILDSSKQEVIVDKLEKAEEEELKKLCKYPEGEKDAIPKDNKYKKGDRYQSKDETSQDTNAADSDSKACSDNTTVSTDEHSDQRRSVHSEGIIDADLHSPQTKHS